MTNDLSVNELRRWVDPKEFHFTTTAELPDSKSVFGQERAMHSLSFGVNIKSPGFHIYAMAVPGIQAEEIIEKFLKEVSSGQKPPDDWCYINNFDNSDNPLVLQLPNGQGVNLRNDMNTFVDRLGTDIPRVFESENYQKETQKIEDTFEQERSSLIAKLTQAAKAKNYSIFQSPEGLILLPTAGGDETSVLGTLGQESKKPSPRLKQADQDLHNLMRETQHQIEQAYHDYKDKLQKLDEQTLGLSIEPMINRLKDKYKDSQSVVLFLEKVRQDILKNASAFKQLDQVKKGQEESPLLKLLEPVSTFDQYKINLIVDNSKAEGIPIIYERNPTYHNLIGAIEHEARFGALVTNYQNIKAGSLHRANGGYLIINVVDLLLQPLSWDALKRALERKKIEIETLGEESRLIATKSLNPEPVSLDVKVILTGEHSVYYLLYQLDKDFQKLFKVKADFASQTDWTPEIVQKFADFVAAFCKAEDLRHFEPEAVSLLIEEAGRMVESKNKVSTKFALLGDLLREASFWSSKNAHSNVTKDDLKKAIEEKIYRSDRVEKEIQELINNGTLLITTMESSVGQLNGLSVVELGDYAFGRPSRITARTSAGKEGVVNIEREIAMGGPIYNKGVMILTGYLREAFSQDIPLSLWASLTFEQVYEEVEGDSASSAELYALLSSLSNLPIRQDLAVTGSVDQRGHVQAIGGVNQKIEGFFAVCKMLGLTGKQGVIIPQSNIQNLMLRDEVIQAVQNEQFHIYPVSTVGEGIALLTGRPVGKISGDGLYSKDSVYGTVQQTLQEYAKKTRAQNRGED